MKSKSILFLLAGLAIGAVAGAYFAPQKTIKKRRGPVKKITQSKKVIKEAASKYEAELRRMDETRNSKTAVNKDRNL